jgi:hypothetical protein
LVVYSISFISLSISVTPRLTLLDSLPEVFLFYRFFSLAVFADCAAFAFLAAFIATTQ